MQDQLLYRTSPDQVAATVPLRNTRARAAEVVIDDPWMSHKPTHLQKLAANNFRLRLANFQQTRCSHDCEFRWLRKATQHTRGKPWHIHAICRICFWFLAKVRVQGSGFGLRCRGLGSGVRAFAFCFECIVGETSCDGRGRMRRLCLPSSQGSVNSGSNQCSASFRSSRQAWY